MTEPALPEESLFYQALEIKAPAERAAFLDRVCRDNAGLRDEVEALLKSHERSGDLLDLPDESAPRAKEPQNDGPGTLIAGKYKLLEDIGEGGMGSVWMAQQTEPVKRLVAVKLIKTGMGSKEVLARFEAERQALALMDHPNIAKVLDAGAMPDGRPYFVLELVKGVPTTKFCDEHRLPPRQRLEMFVPVCQAIQHAHQKGIIHRDLKPSNVLVALYDDRPVPKVIDFGVAKATGQPLTEQTLHTGFGAVVGTVEYMSPEQASFNQLDVDTRSDIYSLGVLLYELLAGTPPFTRNELEKAGVLEMLRVIREEEPSKPSTKLSTSAGLPALAASRGTESAKLTNLVQGDLDWIVMKALEKDRVRRYQTANGLAADLERYLKDEPVQACPPSAIYRFRKFARRNKSMLVMGILVAAALVAGTVVSTWQAIRAEKSLIETERQRNLAESNSQQAEQQRALAESNYQQAERQQALAESSYKQAERQRALAESSYKQARRAVDELFVHIGDDVTLNQPEFQPLRAELLQSALRYYQEFIKTWKDEPAKQAEIAASYRQVADLSQQIGALPEAASAYQKAVELQRKLVQDGDSKRSGDLANNWMMLGRSQQSAGQHDDAARSYEEALSIYRELAEKEPKVARYQSGIAVTLDNLGWLLSVRGKLQEAVNHHEQSVEIHERLVKEHPEDAGLKLGLAGSLSNLGTRLMDLQRFDEALAAKNRRLALLRELVQQRGPRKLYEEEIGGTLNGIGDVYRSNRKQEGWFDQAMAAYKEARGIQERLLRDYPTSIRAQSGLANTLVNMGQVYRLHKDHADALKSFDEAIVVLEKLVGTSPEDISHLSALGTTYDEKGRVLVALKRSDEAVAQYEKAIASQKRLVRLAPSIERYKRDLDMFRRELEQAQKMKK
jgi:eukaryotic-like serine/threonine-protein kinase